MRLPLVAEGTRVAAIMTKRGSQGEGPALDDERLVALYRCARRVRMTDERAQALAERGAIGFQAPATRQEAAILGAAAALREGDWLFPGARDHGAALMRGMPLRRYWDHLFGNADDIVKGRPMPDHFSYREARVASVAAPLGSQLSHAVGMAWSAKAKAGDGPSEVVLVLFGDDEVSSGDFHNAMNFAGVWGAPVVFFCRNDAAMGAAPQAPPTTLADKGIAYGLEGRRISGEDVEQVFAAVREAVDQAARGAGPAFVEAVVSAEADPIARMKELLVARLDWDDDRDRQLETELVAELEAEVSAAQRAPRPPIHSMFEDVYAEMPWHLRDQRDELGQAPRGPRR